MKPLLTLVSWAVTWYGANGRLTLSYGSYQVRVIDTFPLTPDAKRLRSLSRAMMWAGLVDGYFSSRPRSVFIVVNL